MATDETDEFAVIQDPGFFQELTTEVWQDCFQQVGFVYLGVGDEPEGCVSRVYQDRHRELVGLGDNYQIEVKSEAPDFDWEKALAAAGMNPSVKDPAKDQTLTGRKFSESADDGRCRLVLFAGPNGSGKSTITEWFRKHNLLPELYVNPDDIAREISPGDPWGARIAAGRRAVGLRNAYLAAKNSFAMETTLSGNSELTFIKDAVSRGYQVTAVYVAVRGALDNIARVETRVARGGHAIPPDVIARRRERSLVNLSFLIDTLPRILVVDNTCSPRTVLRKNNNRITYTAKDLPDWLARVQQGK